jgi:hypothetical protein
MATYKHLRSSTANKRPTTSITDGQLAINTNTASPGLFFKDSAGTGIVKVGPVHVGTTAPNATPAAGGSSGNYLGEQWLDTSVSPAQMKVWNGSAWVGIVADELPVSKLQDGDARQLLQTDAAGTGVEWTSNVDVPGTLDVTSTATFDSIARHPLGSAAAPTLTFTGDPNTGIYSPGADQVAVATNGTGRLFVDANGNVGVGTSSPVDFAGFVTLALADSSGAEVDFIKGSTVQGSLYNASDIFYIESKSTVPTAFVTNGTERLRITSAGLVGIGTSSPSYKLHVVTDAISGRQDPTNISRTSGNLIRFTNPQFSTDASMGLLLRVFPDADSRQGAGIIANGGTNNGSTTLDLFYTDTAGTSKSGLRISDTGAVGIGTTSPDKPLEIISSGTAGAIVAAFDGTASKAYYQVGGTTSGLYTQIGTDTSTTFINDFFGNGIAFQLAASEKARIDSSGRLLVGTSSAKTNYFGSASIGSNFQVVGSTHAESSVIIHNQAANTQAPYLQLGKARGTGYEIVSSADLLGSFVYFGADGSTMCPAASIDAYVDGTPGANDMPGRLVFSTTADGASSPTERMRINNNGTLSAFASIGDAIIGATGSAAGSVATVFGLNHSATSTTTGTTCLYVLTNGDVRNTNNSYGAISDIKLKENIVDANSQWDDIKSFKVRKYNFKREANQQTHTQIGLVAQEAELVSPGLVSAELLQLWISFTPTTTKA